MHIIPIKTGKVFPFPKVTLQQWISNEILKGGEQLKEGNILVLSSKIVSYFEGNLVKLAEVKVSTPAKKSAEMMNANPALIQLAMNEADEIIAVTPWVLLTLKNGIYSANAGVDKSNVPKGYAITWPKDPFVSAKRIRQALMKIYHIKKLAVIIADSACIPGRKGTIALAIGFSGIGGWQNLKGKKDLYGNVLRYSALNIVDSLSTAANVVMGESTESSPIGIIRGYCLKQPFSRQTVKDEMVILPQDEMFPIAVRKNR